MRTSLAFSVPFVAFALAIALPARAADDCPPGSVHKSENAFEWCEPTVCQSDSQCGGPNEVCRPVAFCMQVGTLTQDAASMGEAGQRLVVTQRCAPDKKCPGTTTCSEMGRCLSKTAAEKMGLLTASAASSSATPAGGDAKKSSCGCDVPGRATGSLAFGFAIALGLAITARRTRRSPRSR